MAQKKGTSPVGELNWVKITRKAVENDKFDSNKYKADLTLEGDEAKDFKRMIDKFASKNLNGRATTFPYTEDGFDGSITFKFKTSATFKDGTERDITLYDRDGDKYSSGKSIGNGSTGRINFTMGEYDYPDNKGVSLFLDEIQLIDHIPFESSNRGFSSI